jgi:hypothetical protein
MCGMRILRGVFRHDVGQSCEVEKISWSVARRPKSFSSSSSSDTGDEFNVEPDSKE